MKDITILGDENNLLFKINSDEALKTEKYVVISLR